MRGDEPLFSSMGPPLEIDPDSGNTTKKPGKQLPFLTKSNRAHTKHFSQHFPDAPAEDGSHSPGPQSPETPIKTKKEPKVEKVIVVNPNLEQMVEDLGAKIAELTALIMTQQGSTPDESL